MPMIRPSAKRSARNAASDMGDLFGKPEPPAELPAGFRYIRDVLSSAEEMSLVQQFEKLPLKPFEFHGYQGNRRIYTFGHRYIFAGQEARADASIPAYLRPLTEIASRISGAPADAFEQLMVTEYAPGAGIGWHRDRPSYEDIVAVSFLAPCTYVCAGKWARTGSADPRTSSHDQSTCFMDRCVTSGSTASRRWMCCAIR